MSVATVVIAEVTDQHIKCGNMFSDNTLKLVALEDKCNILPSSIPSNPSDDEVLYMQYFKIHTVKLLYMTRQTFYQA